MALDKKLADFEQALHRLIESFDQTLSHKDDETYSFYRDSTIQRFEFTLEIAWKSIKQFLLEYEGVECRSPKGCIRELFSAGHLDENSAAMLLQMVDDRNLTTHTYHESLADEIFAHIQTYIDILNAVYRTIQHQSGLSP